MSVRGATCPCSRELIWGWQRSTSALKGARCVICHCVHATPHCFRSAASAYTTCLMLCMDINSARSVLVWCGRQPGADTLGRHEVVLKVVGAAIRAGCGHS